MTNFISSYVTVIVALLTIIGGAGVYAYQKKVDRKTQLIEIRRIAYRAYLASLLDQIQMPTPATQHTLLKCEFDLFAVASDPTIKCVGEFSSYMIATSFDAKEKRDRGLHKLLLAKMILAMRQDCFERSKLSSEDIFKMLPME